MARGRLVPTRIMTAPATLTAVTASPAAIGIEVLGRDTDQPAANAPTLLADFDAVVVHRDDRDTAQLSPRVEETFLLREPLEILLPPGHRLAGGGELRCATWPMSHGSGWRVAWWLTTC